MVEGHESNDEKEEEESYFSPHSSQYRPIDDKPEQPGGAFSDLSDWSSSLWTDSMAEETMLSSIDGNMKEDIGEVHKVIKISSGDEEEAILGEEKDKEDKETGVSVEETPENQGEEVMGTENHPVNLTMSEVESSEDEEFVLSEKEEDKEFNHNDYKDQFEDNYFKTIRDSFDQAGKKLAHCSKQLSNH